MVVIITERGIFIATQPFSIHIHWRFSVYKNRNSHSHAAFNFSSIKKLKFSRKKLSNSSGDFSRHEIFSFLSWFICTYVSAENYFIKFNMCEACRNFFERPFMERLSSDSFSLWVNVKKFSLKYFWSFAWFSIFFSNKILLNFSVCKHLKFKFFFSF
jgi:hypothetical protein